MKKSVYEAMERAKKHSEDFPTIRVWVMDKPRKHAVVCASDFVQRERIVEGGMDGACGISERKASALSRNALRGVAGRCPTQLENGRAKFHRR